MRRVHCAEIIRTHRLGWGVLKTNSRLILWMGKILHQHVFKDQLLKMLDFFLPIHIHFICWKHRPDVSLVAGFDSLVQDVRVVEEVMTAKVPILKLKVEGAPRQVAIFVKSPKWQPYITLGDLFGDINHVHGAVIQAPQG